MGQAGEADIGPRHMEQRHDDQHHLVALIVEPLDLRADLQEAGIVGVHQPHALGQAGGAGGVQLQHVVIGLRRGVIRSDRRRRVAQGLIGRMTQLGGA